MTTWFDLLIRACLFICGASLFAFALIAGIKLAFPNKPISQKERILRSIAVWFSTSLLTPGGLFMISAFSAERIMFEDMTNIMFACIVFSPLALAAAIGTYSRLWGSTKMPGDLLFLDENRKSRD